MINLAFQVVFAEKVFHSNSRRVNSMPTGIALKAKIVEQLAAETFLLIMTS